MPDKRISQLTPTTTVDLADQYALARGSGNFHVSYNTLKTNLSVNTSSFVKTVNAVAPDSSGNVTVSLTAVETGTSASMRAYSSSGLFTEGDVWVISGESGSASGSNGDSYIYSGDNTLLRLSGLDTAGNDTRYVNVSGDTMTGDLILNGAPTTNNQAATKAYVDGLTTNGTNGQTIRFNGTTPTANSFLFNNGSSIGINTTSPARMLHVSTGNNDPAARFENTSGTGTVIELKTTGPDRTLSLESDHINPDGNLVIGNSTGGGIISLLTTSGNHVRVNSKIENLVDPTAAQDAATKAYVDSRGTSGTNGQTIRFNGTTPTSNSFLFNNGSQIGVGTTTPKANLHVNSNMKIGSSTLNRDYMQVVVTGDTGSIVNVNEVFKLHASGSTSTLELRSDARDIEIIPGDEARVKGPLVVQDATSAKSGEQIKITTVAAQNPGIEFDAGAKGGNIYMSGSEGNFYVGSRAGFPDNSRNISADEPTLSHHLTTKNYVDGLATGANWAGGYGSGNGAFAGKYDFPNYFDSTVTNVSWSTANDEWAITVPGTYLVSTNGHWRDVNSKTLQLRYSTTAGTGATGGTLLAAQAASTTAKNWDFFGRFTITTTTYVWLHNQSGTGLVNNWKIQIEKLA